MRPGEARNADVLPGQNGFKTPHLGHSIGPNATLIFNVELVAIRPRMKEES
jgi:FKBP-type peptidyl-prolyl cis-trans isomerase